MTTISGTSSGDNLNGGSGDDLIDGGSGNDMLSGGAGSDTLLGGDGSDKLSGGSGEDSLSGGTGNDSLVGGSGNDTLDGGSGSDNLNGDAGNDVLIYSLTENLGGADLYTGGSGIDTVQVVFDSHSQWTTYRTVIQGYLNHLATVSTSASGEVSNGKASDYTLDFGSGTKLTVSMMETLQVFIGGVKIIDSGDRTASALTTPDLIDSSDSGPSSIDNITNDSTPTFSGVGAEPLATITLYGSDGVTVLGTTVANLAGDWTITTGTLPDGIYQVAVKQTDLMGNTSPLSPALEVEVDTTADEGADLALSITDTTINNAEKTAVGFSVAGLDGDATGVVTFSDGVNSVSVNVGGNGSYSVDLSTLSDGSISSVLNVTDDAGNTDSANGAAIDLDTTADEGADLALSITDTTINNAEKTAVWS
jgi:hypothetical protein